MADQEIQNELLSVQVVLLEEEPDVQRRSQALRSTKAATGTTLTEVVDRITAMNRGLLDLQRRLRFRQ